MNLYFFLFSKVLVFIGVIILVLGTYATLYAANEPGNAGRIEAVSPVPDHFDSIARMTLVELKKPVANEIVADKLTADEKSKGTDFDIPFHFCITYLIYFL